MTLVGNALVIGAAVDGLTGVEHDVEAMAQVLRAYGFTVEMLSGKDATRAGILQAYERLIRMARPDQGAVVYYSGHGGRAAAPAATDGGPDLMDLQFIVPVDFHDATPGDFRGITNVELSVLLARLTAVTRNVTAIFDCCHSGQVSRDELRLKTLVDHLTPYEVLQDHVERLRREGLRTDLLQSGGNQHAVRIVACAPEQSAFEYPGTAGTGIGMMTEALALALTETLGERVTWASVLDGVRRRVNVLQSSQRPDAEGPVRRLLFDTAEGEPLDTLRVTDLGAGRLQLSCAALLGVRRGDTFAVVSASGGKIGEMTVDRVGPMAAEGPVTTAAGIIEIPVGAQARRTSSAAPALPVRLPEVGVRSGDLERALALSPMLHAAESGEPASVEVLIDTDGALTVADGIGPLHAPRPAGPDSAARVVRDLVALARAQALRGLTVEGVWALNAPVDLEWGVVRDHARHRLPEAGAVVAVGTRIYISVRNNDPAEAVYVTLVDIGVSGRITVLTNFAAPGVRLRAGGEYVFGFDDHAGVLNGATLEWPDDLKPAHARPETVLLFVTSEPQDFSALSQDGISAKRTGISPLARVLRQIAVGGPRELRAAPDPAARFDVKTVSFDVIRSSETAS